MLGAEKQAKGLGSTLDLNLDYLEPIVIEKLKQHVTAGGFRLFDITTKVSGVTNWAFVTEFLRHRPSIVFSLGVDNHHSQSL